MSGAGDNRSRRTKRTVAPGGSGPFLSQDEGGSPLMSPVGSVDEEMDRQPLLVDADDAREGLVDGPNRAWLSYVRTRHFWTVLLLGQVAALCITGTNTLSSLLAGQGASMPAFQTFFTYCLLNVIYTSYTMYKYGFQKWTALVRRDGWRYFILSVLDVEGNYFLVLAYRYTTILSAQLINFWAIVVVVVISLTLLRVRYHLTQYAGILMCCGGMGILLASDNITGSNGGIAVNHLQGDLFAFVGATFYGLSNCFEEFLVSKRPMYEVLGQLAFWGMFINGMQATILDGDSFRGVAWNSQVGSYLVGYTVVLSAFYSLVPIILRLSSAAFFNISLLTSNFWGVVIGLGIFHLHIHWMYPVAFLLIISGCFVYFMSEGINGEARKPWLGQDGIASGIGTGRNSMEN